LPTGTLEASSGDNNKPSIIYADGGVERQDSVLAGLAAASHRAEYIAIHDGARPLISASVVRKVLAAAKHMGAATCATPVTDTLKRAGTGQTLVESINRSNLWAMQTPQIFRASLIRETTAKAKLDGQRLTDEVSALMLANQPVQVIHNTEWNPKVTFPSDLELAEALLSLGNRLRVTMPGA
jgi:2-C-methyl-D-erythritol 4-phosphate cytidylyltransferase